MNTFIHDGLFLTLYFSYNSNSLTSSSSNSNSLTSSSSTSPVSPPSTAAQTPTLSSHSEVVVGAIAGGTVGASLFLLFIVGTILFLYRRRWRRSDVMNQNPPNTLAGMGYVDTNISIATPLGPSSQLIAPPSTYLRRAQISRELENRQQELAAALEEVRHGQYPSFSVPTSQIAMDTVHRRSEAVLESQVEELEREVTRLRRMLGVISKLWKSL